MNQVSTTASQFNTIYQTVAIIFVLIIGIGVIWSLLRFGTFKATKDDNERLRTRVEDLEREATARDAKIARMDARLESLEAENKSLRHEYQECYLKLNQAYQEIINKDNKIIYQQDKIHDLEIEKAAHWKPTRRGADG